MTDPHLPRCGSPPRLQMAMSDEQPGVGAQARDKSTKATRRSSAAVHLQRTLLDFNFKYRRPRPGLSAAARGQERLFGGCSVNVRRWHVAGMAARGSMATA